MATEVEKEGPGYGVWGTGYGVPGFGKHGIWKKTGCGKYRVWKTWGVENKGSGAKHGA